MKHEASNALADFVHRDRLARDPGDERPDTPQRVPMIVLCAVVALVFMFGIGYASGIARSGHESTIGTQDTPSVHCAAGEVIDLLGCVTIDILIGENAPPALVGGSPVSFGLHCAEDTVIAFTGDGDALGCVHIETITQQELDRVHALQLQGYDVEVYGLGDSPDDCVYGETWRNDACFPLSLEELAE